MPRVRPLLATVHLWLGLTLGALFVVIGVTGSLITFQPELDRLLNPGLLVPQSSADKIIPTADAVHAVRKKIADSELVSYVARPGEDGAVYQVYVGTRDDIFARMVTVDPGSGTILGERPVGESLMRFVHLLHFRLHLGRSGQTLVGFSGLFLLLSLFSGVLLWWRGGRIWRPLAPAPRWRMHHSIGVYGGGPLLVVLVTGIVLALPQYTRPTVNWFSPLGGLDLDVKSTAPNDDDDIGVAAALDRARAALPDGAVTSVGLPRRPRDSYRVTVRQPEGGPARRGHVVIDRYSGAVLARRHWDERSTGDRFMAWQRPLHSGTAFGLPGRIAVAALGLVPLLLFITGLWLWLRRLLQAGSRRAEH